MRLRSHGAAGSPKAWASVTSYRDKGTKGRGGDFTNWSDQVFRAPPAATRRASTNLSSVSMRSRAADDCAEDLS